VRTLAVFKDDGGGITERSMQYFRKIRPRLGKMIKAVASFEPLRQEIKHGTVEDAPYDFLADYNLILTDEKGNEVWLSGCNCSYSGTGCWGTFEVLREVGLLPEDIRFEDTEIPKMKRCEWIQHEPHNE